MHRQRVQIAPYQGIGSMAAANLDAWFHSPRVWMIMICVAVYSILQAAADAQDLQVNGVQIPLTLLEMLFFKLDKGFFLMSSLLFLIMVSELPRRISFQNHMLIRTTRVRWVLSQCLYCVWMVLSMMLVLILIYSLFALPHAAHGNGFTENEIIRAERYAEEASLVPAYIRYNTTPITACLLAALPMFFFWMTMVLIILLFGLMGFPLLGPIIYGFLLLAHVTILFEAMPEWLKLPIAFSTLCNITVAYPKEELSRLFKVMAGYLMLDGLLIIVLCFIGKKAELVFYSNNKE